jgi:hypothetical protein
LTPGQKRDEESQVQDAGVECQGDHYVFSASNELIVMVNCKKFTLKQIFIDSIYWWQAIPVDLSYKPRRHSVGKTDSITPDDKPFHLSVIDCNNYLCP